VLRDAIRRGCRLAQITTYLGNDAALRAYEKADFKVLDENRCSELEKILGVPGFVRLTRQLKIDRRFFHTAYRCNQKLSKLKHYAAIVGRLKENYGRCSYARTRTTLGA
jgi:hypothetical protein